jgi:hypothetical protein
MTKTTSFLIGAAMLGSAAIMPLAVFAQSNQATMPVLYDQSGHAVNNGTTALPAGYYFLQPGVSNSQVYYYGNGTYYNPSIGQYGGSIGNPNGTSGALLGYASSPTTVAAAPGVPNTGAGGASPVSWAILIASGAAVLAGAAYLAFELSRPKQFA